MLSLIEKDMFSFQCVVNRHIGCVIIMLSMKTKKCFFLLVVYELHLIDYAWRLYFDVVNIQQISN